MRVRRQLLQHGLPSKRPHHACTCTCLHPPISLVESLALDMACPVQITGTGGPYVRLFY